MLDVQRTVDGRNVLIKAKRAKKTNKTTIILLLTLLVDYRNIRKKSFRNYKIARRIISQYIISSYNIRNITQVYICRNL
jgi:hypothetical protein